MNALIDLCVSRSRAVLVALAVLLFAGGAAYRGLPKEAQPDVDFPFISVEVVLDGVAAEDAERLLVRPLEQQLRNIEGIKEMIASATENRASITLEFGPEVDVDQALTDVRERVDQARAELPEDAREPTVNEVKFSRFDPMLVINLGGALPERTMNAIATDLQDRIQSIDGVLEVNMVGIRQEILEIVVNPLNLESYGLSPADVLNFVQRNNRLVAAGSLQSEQGRFAVKVPGVIESPEDVLALPMKVDGERVVRFRDIAEVRRAFKDPESYARLNGETAVGIRVVQRNGSNILNVVGAVKTAVADAQKDWPEGISLTYSRDKSVRVQEDINQLVNDVVVAVLLVVICLIGILGLQNALLAGISIPGSFAAAFVLLAMTDMTMNLVVFFGLIMSVGLVVDGAIVVVELADRRMAEGLDRRVAYAEAAKRMAWPIFASIAATIVAFLPLIFWPGIIGSFLRYMPIVLIYTLAASLVIAMFVVPALGAIFGRSGHISPGARSQLMLAENGDLGQLRGGTGQYLRIVTAAIDRPWITAGSVTALLLGVFVTYGTLGRGITLFPNVDPEQGSVDIRARGDLSTQEKDRLVRTVEERVYGVKGIKHVYVTSGAGARGSSPDQIGAISLNFVNWRERRPASEIIAEIRERTADIAGIVVEPRLPEDGPIQGKPLNIEASGPSLDNLRDAVDKLRAFVETIPGVINAEDTRPLPGIEWRMEVDRAQAAKFGADVSLVGNIIQLVTNGIKLGTYRPDDSDEEIDIRVRFPSDDRSLDKLAALRIPTKSGNVPMGSFVTREPAEATRTITRTDMRRTMLVQADLEKGVLIEPVLDQVRAALPSLDLDPGIQLRFKGGAKDQQETASFLGKAFLVGLGLIALILVAEFNSLFQPLLVLTAVVFSTGGVLLGLLVTGRPFSLVNCGIGTIALAGIIVNNNIVLIDTYNKLREAGMAAREAVLRTCAQRLRPVLLTKVVMILGLLPMALRLNIDILERKIYFGGPSGQWWAEMATVIIGGLIFASILTLVLTPSILMIQARIGEWFARRYADGMAAIITLTTDFGLKGPFVGVMKGAILSRLPDARIVDLTHEIPVHWPIEAGFWLARAYRYFPAGTVHVAVVDPGVGTARSIIAGERDGHVFLGPDNGLLWPILRPEPGAAGSARIRCHRLSEAWRQQQDWPSPSSTFHGRDIFAPLAADLAAGRLTIGDIGPAAGDLIPSLQEDARAGAHDVRGTVVAIDNFGNLITNIDGSLIAGFRKPDVLAGGRRLPLRRTYGDVRPGEFLALVNSFGVLEIARAEGSAADSLGLGRGAPILVLNATK